MNNKKTNLLAFNLIEMIVTMSIVAILTGIGITKFNQLKTPKEIIDETTNIILTTINQTVYKSLNNSVPQDICNIQAGSGTNRASCKTTDFINNSWSNVNNNLFNNLVTVQFTPKPPTTKFISKITYIQGLISEITYTDNTTTTIYTNNENIIPPIIINNENIITPIIINVGLTSNLSGCFNTINLWPNNVTSVDKSCNI